FLCYSRLSIFLFFFFFSSRRRHTRFSRDWSSDVCSSDLAPSWVPAERISLAVALTIRFIPTVRTTLAEVRMAQKARGLERSLTRSEERRVGKEGRERGARDE